MLKKINVGLFVFLIMKNAPFRQNQKIPVRNIQWGF